MSSELVQRRNLLTCILTWIAQTVSFSEDSIPDRIRTILFLVAPPQIGKPKKGNTNIHEKKVLAKAVDFKRKRNSLLPVCAVLSFNSPDERRCSGVTPTESTFRAMQKCVRISRSARSCFAALLSSSDLPVVRSFSDQPDLYRRKKVYPFYYTSYDFGPCHCRSLIVVRRRTRQSSCSSPFVRTAGVSYCARISGQLIVEFAKSFPSHATLGNAECLYNASVVIGPSPGHTISCGALACLLDGA